MAGRYAGPVRFFYLGDSGLAQQYNGVARKLVAYLQNQSDLIRDNLWTASRKVQISDGVIIEVQKVTDLIYNAYIDVRGITTSAPILKVYQYQFVYTGHGVEWTVEMLTSTLPVTGGSAVGVLFIIREDSTHHLSIPLVSTLKVPPSGADPTWVYTNSLLGGGTTTWMESLLIPRYEVVHATSQHQFFPDEYNIVHSAWMPKGQRHYMAQAHTLSALRQAGTLNGIAGDFGDGRMGVVYTDSPEYGQNSTDVGYESDLARFIAPQATLGELLTTGPKKGEHQNSAPDADWYTSYGVQEVETPSGEKRIFGIFVDAAQRVYVWPVEAAGTGTPDPTYSDTLIKTNVGAQYVKSQDLVFPAEVLAETASWRDISLGIDISDSDQFFFDGPYAELTRYVWHCRHDGQRFCTIVERNVPVPALYYSSYEEFVPTAPDYFFADQKPYRFGDPAVAEFSVLVEVTGEALEQFDITVSPVTTIEPGNFMTPIQAKYSTKSSFAGVEQGELLVAGFEVRRLSESLDTWRVTQGLNNLDHAWTHNAVLEYRRQFVCNAVSNASLPAALAGSYTYADLDNGTTWADESNRIYRRLNFHYGYNMPRYMMQDMPFTRLGYIPDVLANGTESTQFVVDETSQHWKSWVNEGAMVVRKADADDTEVFRCTVRKFKENRFDFGNFFTAQITSLDISTGSFVAGLCDSTTWVSGVERPMRRYTNHQGVPEGGMMNDHSGHEGVNTAVKGYVVVHHGTVVAQNAPKLTEQLYRPLESHPVPKDMNFWGTLYIASMVRVPQPWELVPYGTVPVNADYPSYLLNNGFVNNQFDLPAGRLGLPEFPWGLEIYSWFTRSHFSAASGRESNHVLAGEKFIAYTGTYLDIKDPIRVDVETHATLGPIDMQMENIDVIQVGGVSFTHAQLYEEAFGEAPDLTYDIRLNNMYRGALTTEGDHLGYPHQMTAPSNDVENWLTLDIFCPFAMSHRENGAEYLAVNLLLPQTRMYCDTGRFPYNIHFDGSIANDRLESTKARGTYKPKFLARAFCALAVDLPPEEQS